MKNRNKLIFFTFITLVTTQIAAQKEVNKLTSKEQKTVIDSICNKLQSNYVFPQVAKKMSSSLLSNYKKGEYNQKLDPQEFAITLTENLQSVSQDKHLEISFDPKGIAEQKKIRTPVDSLAFLNKYVDSIKRDNFGFKEVKILEGNIGYLDLRSFSEVKYAGETAISAMNFISNTDALIVDLRYNNGGEPAMIQLITSYFFESKPIHLNDFYWRSTDSNSQTWTLPYVPGKRSPDTPLYILTSSRTFSAAEEFSYNLKHLNRATIIGEYTGGGAHPNDLFTVTDKYQIWIPNGRAINPITKTNWEGTGVKPHIEILAKKALDIAYIKALEVLLEKNKDQDLKKFYEWPLAELRVKINPIHLDNEKLKSFIGNYDSRIITLENGILFYQKKNGIKYELYPYSNNEFMLKKGSGNFRIRFLFKDNKVTTMQGLYSDGRSTSFLKS